MSIAHDRTYSVDEVSCVDKRVGQRECGAPVGGRCFWYRDLQSKMMKSVASSALHRTYIGGSDVKEIFVFSDSPSRESSKEIDASAAFVVMFNSIRPKQISWVGLTKTPHYASSGGLQNRDTTISGKLTQFKSLHYRNVQVLWVTGNKASGELQDSEAIFFLTVGQKPVLTHCVNWGEEPTFSKPILLKAWQSKYLPA